MTIYFYFHIITYLAVGAFSGFISGLLGLGGGVIVVPALSSVFDHLGVEHPMHLAIGTSLAIMVLTTVSSARAHYRKGSIRIDIWKKWIIGLIFGAVLGAFIASLLKSSALEMIFSVFLFLISIKLALGSKLPSFKVQDSWYVLLPAGIFMGTFSGMLGVGGGVMMVPLLLALGCHMNEAAGTSAASSLPLAIVGAVTYSFLGYHEHTAIQWAVGYVYLPAFLVVSITGMLCAPLGASLAHKIPSRRLKRLFSIVLFVISLKMIIS